MGYLQEEGDTARLASTDKGRHVLRKNHSWTFKGKGSESRLKGIGKKLPNQSQCNRCNLCKTRTDDCL